MPPKDGKLLVLSGGDEKKFEILYAAVRAVFPKHAKGIAQLRLCNRIMEKLEEISIESPQDQDEFARTLLPGRQELLLIGQEYDKLKSMVTDDDIGWTWRLGLVVEETADWIEKVEEVDVSAKA